jgi:hypothetical protein
MVKPDHGLIPDLRQQWRGWAVEQQSADGIGQGGDMIAARGAQGAAELVFFVHFRSP